MFEVLTGLFDTSGFTRRAECGTGWSAGLIWLSATSDLFIWLAYVSIPLVLLYFTRRRNLPFPKLFVLFAAFILACGTTHFLDALVFNYPLYRLAAVVKAVTAIVSWVTVVSLIQVIPRVVPLLDAAAPTPADTKAHHPLAPREDNGAIRGYIVALLAAVLAVLIRKAADPLLNDDHIFVVALLAVVYVSWQYGFKPGMLTLVIGVGGYSYLFVPPRNSFIVTGLGNQLAIALFFFCGVACAALGESQRAAQRRARAALATALARQDELEAEVTRRRAVEASLRAREGELTAARDQAAEALARLDAFFDNAPVGIVFFDPDLRYKKVNEFLAAVNGVPAADHLGKSLTEVVPNFPAETAATYRRIARGEADGYTGTLQRRDAAGRQRAWQVTAFPVRRAGRPTLGAGVVLHDITERVRAEQELKRSERNLADFFENANVGLHWVDAGGVVVRANKAELEMLGYERGEYVGHRVEEFHESRETIADILARLQRGERLDNHPARLRRKDGSVRDVLISSTALVEDNRFVHSRCFTRDVTDQKRAADELAEQARVSSLRADVAAALGAADETRVALLHCAETLVERLGAAIARIWTTDPTGEWLELQASAGAAAAGGADAHGGRVRVGEFKVGRIAQAQTPLLTNDVPHDPNMTDPAWAARERLQAFAGYPLVIEGRVLGVVALFARQALSERVLADLGPVTASIAQFIELRRVEAATRRSEGRYRTLTEAVPQIVWNADAGGEITYFNRRWLDHTALPVERAHGRGWMAAVHPDDRDRVYASWRRTVDHVATGGADRFAEELRLLHAETGAYRWFVSVAVPLWHAGGSVDQWIGSMADIHDQKVAVEQVADANRFLEASIDAMSSHIAVLDPDGTIVKVNAAWRRFARANGLALPDDGVGRNYLTDCNGCGEGEDQQRIADGIRAVIAGELSRFQLEYPCHSPTEQRWFLMSVNRFPGEGPVRVVVAHEDITARVQGEAATRESEAFRRSVFENSPDCLKVIDTDGRVVEMNAAGCALMELDDPAAVVGGAWADMWPAANRESVREALAAARAGEVGRFQGFCPTAKGTPKYWDVSVAPLPAADGRPLRLLGVSRDVTEQRRAEERIRESEELFRQMAESIPQLAWMTDPDGYIFWYNQRWYEYTGTTFEQMQGWGWEAVHDPVELARMLPRWKAHLASGEPWEDTFPLRGADGKYRWHLSRALPMRDKLGNVVRWFGTNTDISAQRELAETLRSSEERFRTLTETVPQIVWRADPHGEVTFFNRRWAEYTGQELDAGRRDGWGAGLVHPDDAAEFNAGWRLAVARQADGFSREFRLRRAADGEYRWFLSAAVPLRDPAGGVAEWVGSLTDIDDQKRQSEYLERVVRERTAALEESNGALQEEIGVRQDAEEKVRAVAIELERSNGELEKFAYVASHDLQEPLRKIQAFGDRLATKCRDSLPANGKEYIDRMLTAAGRMRRLIDDLLSFSRVTSQQRPFARLDLGKLVDEVVSDLDIRLSQAGGEVRVGTLPPIDADPTQMRQLFQNLIANAIKFQRPNVPPVVEIGAEVVDQTTGADAPLCRITVRDNGIGFDEKYRERIFEVFQRLHGRDEYEGTGVGLAICRKITERHGGTITARSDGPGTGAAFVIVLPLRQANSNEGTDDNGAHG